MGLVAKRMLSIEKVTLPPALMVLEVWEASVAVTSMLEFAVGVVEAGVTVSVVMALLTVMEDGAALRGR